MAGVACEAGCCCCTASRDRGSDDDDGGDNGETNGNKSRRVMLSRRGWKMLSVPVSAS